MRRISAAYRSAPKKVFDCSSFRGIDLYNSPADVSPERSPDAPNMIRDVPGKIRKRMGYHCVSNYDERINGIFLLTSSGESSTIVHSGTKLYAGDTLLYSSMNDSRSKGWQLGDKLYISDGAAFIYCDGSTAAPVTEIAYVPKIVIGRAPSGGGTQHEQLNLLSAYWKESFLSDASSSIYQLSYDSLDEGFCEVKVMTSAGVWTNQTMGTHYTFNPTLGQVTFLSGNIPSASPVEGADNVEIKVKKTRQDYVDRINKCDISTLYGVNAASDRLFVTGNPDFINYDWFSEMNNPSYFPASSYSILGMTTRITGYSIVNDRLAAHKMGDSDGRNIILREGKMVDGKAAFPIVNALQGAKTVSGHTIAYLTTEPLFLSENGIYAITPADVTGERYTQNRSIFINSALANEDLTDAVAAVYNDFYLLAVGGKLYILDSLMKSCEKGAPYSTHQYEAFLFTNIDARVLFVKDKKLWFGTDEGAIMEFFTDPKNPSAYSDDGQVITAYWKTPLLSGASFYSNKSYKYLALKLTPATATSVKVYAEKNGLLAFLFEESEKLTCFSFAHICFSRFNFSTDATPRAIGKRINIQKTDKASFLFQNDKLYEPFALSNYSLEFYESGKIK